MIITLIILIVIFIGFSLYNSIIGRKNQVTNTFSTIDVMLKKRFELLPNLIETVKQYMSYEGRLLGKIVELRSKAANTNISSIEKLEIDNQLSSNVKGLMVSVENYPDLKADQNFLNLQNTWTESEDQIAAAGRTYNASVINYNNAIMMMPGRLFAGILNFQPMEVLNNTEEERKSISAKQLFNS